MVDLGDFPSVTVREQDNSRVVRGSTDAQIALVVDSDKGPVPEKSSQNGLEQISTVNEYSIEYGDPTTSLQRSAVNVLRAGQSVNTPPKVFIVRALPGDDSALWGGIEYSGTGSTALANGVNFPVENYSPPSGTSFAIFSNQPSSDNSNTGIEIDSGTGNSDTFFVRVHRREDSDDSFTQEEEHEVALKDLKDNQGIQRNIEDRLSEDSDYVLAVNNSDDNSFPPNESTPKPLGGGTAGSDITASDLIDAAQDIRNTDEDLQLTITGGYTNASNPKFANEMIDIATSRRDHVALIDTPEDADKDTIVDTFLPSLTVPSPVENPGSYVAVYGPWLEDFEPLTNKTVTNPPTPYVAKNMLISFINNDPWDAVAGLRRGQLGIDQINKKFTDAEQETLVEDNVNLIVEDSVAGPTIWGQRTFQSFASATDRLNVRFLMLHIEENLEEFSKQFLFEANNPTTRRAMTANFEQFLRRIDGAGGIQDWDVVIDETNNTASVIDNNELRADVIVDPTRTAENILLQFTIVNTGEVDISETIIA